MPRPVTIQSWLVSEIKKYIKLQKAKRQITRFLIKDYLESVTLFYCLDIEKMRPDIEVAIKTVERDMKTSFPQGSLFEVTARISRYRENLARKKNQQETPGLSDKNRKIN